MVLAQMERKGKQGQAVSTGMPGLHEPGEAAVEQERQEEPENKVARKQRKRPGHREIGEH